MIRNIFLLVLSALCAWSCTALDDAIVQGPATEPQPADAPHSLRITVAPKPAFAEAAINMPDGIPLPQTRTVQTDEGTKWEEGDLVWLYVEFTDTDNQFHRHYSALKYTGTTWRYLTETEANSLELKSYPNKSTFNRTLIYGQADGSTQYVEAYIIAFYAGNSKPDANGLITIPAPDSGSSVPVMEAYSTTLGDLSQPLTLDFTYCCSRLRIPADYGVQMGNYRYYASWSMNNGVLNIKTVATLSTSLPPPPPETSSSSRLRMARAPPPPSPSPGAAAPRGLSRPGPAPAPPPVPQTTTASPTPFPTSRPAE